MGNMVERSESRKIGGELLQVESEQVRKVGVHSELSQRVDPAWGKAQAWWSKLG